MKTIITKIILPEYEHRKLKVICAKAGITIKEYMQAALIASIQKDYTK